ncbi:MAG: Hsp70 family protein [Desulfobacterales bacterium]|nr:Hsp70 family protein [Desulfobacterales bacterium]
MEPIVGIDLGTTNSEIAFIIDDNAEVIKDGDNGIMPSCVGLNGKGKIVVGREALNQAVIAPEKTVLSVKRRMGSDEKIRLGNQAYYPQEISAFILKALRERAESQLGKPVGKAVITVPAYFTDAQRQATREAGLIAGLDVVRIINEPTAASLAYESIHAHSRTVLVYDLGGGTFDVSIVKIENGIIEVLASTGDNHLGGDDFDAKIVDRLVDYIQNQLKVTVRDNPVVMARLKQAAEKAKIALSSAPFVTIEEDHIGKRFFKDVHLSYELSCRDFESMIEDDLSRTMDAVGKALKDSGLNPSQIDKVILVGGSTRIPAISKMLEKKIGQTPHGEIDADLCVALGAAIQAGREMGIDHTSILLDITPYTFGTSALGMDDDYPFGEIYVPLIRRNTKLPASRSEVFFTLYDRQEAVEIKIFQGESPVISENVLIGNYMFKLSQLPENSEIVMKMDLDLNGILKMHAVEKKTGNNIDFVIENAMRQFTAQELDESKKRLEILWDSDRFSSEKSEESTLPSTDASVPEIKGEYVWLIKQAEEKLGSADREDRDEIVNLIADLKNALSEKDDARAEKVAETLEDILFYIG